MRNWGEYFCDDRVHRVTSNPQTTTDDAQIVADFDVIWIWIWIWIWIYSVDDYREEVMGGMGHSERRLRREERFENVIWRENEVENENGKT